MELLILDKAAFPSGTVLSKQARTCAHTHTHARTHSLTHNRRSCKTCLLRSSI